MQKLKGRIINFHKNNLKNKDTGEVTVMYDVNFEVETDPIPNHYGPIILNSYCSENAFSKLNACLGKVVEIGIEDKAVFGKTNMYKKVVSTIDGFKVREFN